MTAGQVPAATAPTPDERRRRRRVVWVIVVGGLLLLGAGVMSAALLIGNFVKGMAAEPWALLHQAAEETKTEAGAEAFHRRHPGLTERYPTPAAFVSASRGWSAKVAKLPREVPGLMEVVKGGGEMNVQRSNDLTTFTLGRFHGVDAKVVTRGDTLVDLTIE